MKKQAKEIYKPVLLNESSLKTLAKRKKTLIADKYPEMLEELFLLRNPKYRYNKNYKKEFAVFRKKHFDGEGAGKTGTWFYFPWLNKAVHFLPEHLHNELRTGRNRFLITAKEQDKYYKAHIGIAGMSVGSHAALTMVMTGGAGSIKIADPDALSGSNLNRIRTGFTNVGVNKCVAAARQIYEINPYAKILVYPKGLEEKNIDRFMKGLDIMIEEMDNPYFKIKTREVARKYGIPVIMGTDNGDNIIVDVERFDLNKKLPILHGLIGGMTSLDFKNILPKELPKIAARIAGADLATPRMLESVAEVGKSLYSWPQLGTAATLCGSTLAYLARKIIVGERIAPGRYQINLDSIFEPGYSSARSAKNRKLAFKKFLKKMGK